MTHSLNIQRGSKVHYDPYPGKVKPLNGIVTDFHPRILRYAWIVYHCDNDWKNYINYTSELTDLNDVNEGWSENASNKL